MKLLVVSICKDEAKTIGQVLDRIPSKIEGIDTIEKWVIDDGSTDNTAVVAKKHGAHVLADGFNKRLAFRFREALEVALRRKADVLVNIDGDLQFDPEEISMLVKPILQDKADFVAADRFTDMKTSQIRQPEGMPLAKYWGNKFGAMIVSMLSKHKFRDVTCGFRAYNKRAMVALNINGEYTYTQESFQVLAMKRLRIVALPVTIHYFPGRKSRVVTSIFKFIAQSGVNILRSYRDFAPLRFFGTLGLIPFVFGLLNLTFFFGHWLLTGNFSPYKFLGFSGIYFITMAFIFWALGLVADMLSRMLNNQEKIMEIVKEIRWDAERDSHK